MQGASGSSSPARESVRAGRWLYPGPALKPAGGYPAGDWRGFLPGVSIAQGKGAHTRGNARDTGSICNGLQLISRRGKAGAFVSAPAIRGIPTSGGPKSGCVPPIFPGISGLPFDPGCLIPPPVHSQVPNYFHGQTRRCQRISSTHLHPPLSDEPRLQTQIV